MSPKPEASPLTDRQSEVFSAFVAYRRSHGRPPTMRVLGELTGCKHQTGILGHLRTLVRKGRLVHLGDRRALPYDLPECVASAQEVS